MKSKPDFITSLPAARNSSLAIIYKGRNTTTNIRDSEMLSKASKQTKPSKVLCRDAYGEGVIFYVGNYKLQTQSSKQFLLGREQGYGRAYRAPKDADDVLLLTVARASFYCLRVSYLRV